MGRVQIFCRCSAKFKIMQESTFRNNNNNNNRLPEGSSYWTPDAYKQYMNYAA